MTIRPEEMHLAEEWFHGQIETPDAVQRLRTCAEGREDQGDGLFLVRESSEWTFLLTTDACSRRHFCGRHDDLVYQRWQIESHAHQDVRCARHTLLLL